MRVVLPVLALLLLVTPPAWPQASIPIDQRLECNRSDQRVGREINRRSFMLRQQEWDYGGGPLSFAEAQEARNRLFVDTYALRQKHKDAIYNGGPDACLHYEALLMEMIERIYEDAFR